MNKKKLKDSVEISILKESTIRGNFDKAVEVDYSNLQVTEQEAVKLAIDKFNEESCPKGLTAKLSEDAELKVDRSKKNITFGIELFNES